MDNPHIAAEIIITTKNDVMTAREVRRLSSAALQHYNNKDWKKYGRTVSKMHAKTNELVKNMGILQYGASSKQMMILVDEKCSKVSILK